MGYTAESIIAGGEQSYTGRGFNASLQGFYCRQIVINEDVTASGFLAQDINGDDITSEVVDASSITRLKIGQLLTFRTPVYRVTASDGSMTFYGEGQTRELPDPYLGTTLAPYSLAFDARAAEQLSDYEAGTLYFRDSNFARVPATFSRTTTATRVNKQGLIETVAANVPRIDYTDGSAKLLMEPSRTNAILNSENPNTFDWGGITQTTQNISLTPSFESQIGVNVISVKDTTDNGQHRIIQSSINTSTFTGTRTYTLSCYIKRNGIDYIRLFVDGTMNGRINLVNGTNNLSGGVGVNSVSTTMLPNGYVRLVLTYTKTNTTAATGQYIILWHSPDGVATSYIGDSTKGTLIYGLQHEIGSYPTSYIPTSGSAVTRNADDLYIDNLTTNGYLNAAFTIYRNYDGQDTGAAFERDFSIGDAAPNSSNGALQIGTRLGTQARGIIYNQGYDNLLIPLRGKQAYRSNGTSATNIFQGGTKYNFNGGSFNGTLAGTLEYMIIAGRFANFGTYTAATQTSTLILFPTELTDSECQQLTS